MKILHTIRIHGHVIRFYYSVADSLWICFRRSKIDLKSDSRASKIASRYFQGTNLGMLGLSQLKDAFDVDKKDYQKHPF